VQQSPSASDVPGAHGVPRIQRGIEPHALVARQYISETIDEPETVYDPGIWDTPGSHDAAQVLPGTSGSFVPLKKTLTSCPRGKQARAFSMRNGVLHQARHFCTKFVSQIKYLYGIKALILKQFSV
jgi:hypothetical protein